MNPKKLTTTFLRCNWNKISFTGSSNLGYEMFNKVEVTSKGWWWYLMQLWFEEMWDVIYLFNFDNANAMDIHIIIIIHIDNINLTFH